MSIYDYEKLLNGFYEENIRYDINKRYFLRKGDIHKEYYSETIEKYPKLLRNRPEEFFEIDFVKYLKNHCRDTVIKEYTTATDDRYDVLVRNEDDQHVYVFEIKWLGKLNSFLLGILYLKSVVDYNQAVRETTFEDINISDIPDGVYVGKYDVDFIHAEVEIIADKIVDEQKIDVDAISGATNSSVGIKRRLKIVISLSDQMSRKRENSILRSMQKKQLYSISRQQINISRQSNCFGISDRL